MPEGTSSGPPVLQPAPADALRDLRLELHAKCTRVEELEADLRAAEDQVHRLEAELRVRAARINELARSSQSAEPGSHDEAPNAAAEHSMLSTTPDMAAMYAAADASEQGSAASSVGQRVRPAAEDEHRENPAPANAAYSAEGVSRFLVLMDGDNEVVHLLGRSTTLGRGTENDIQIDQQFVSRHHALIIAGPNQTVIEDLRSTNGVLVNGQRLRRCVLADGDVILIGKTQFRFARRRSQSA